MILREISLVEILAMPKIYRLNLINSIPGFKSANLIGTADGASNNLAVFSSVIHIGSNPPLLGMIVRPTTVPRHTYENIISTGKYTINHINSEIIAMAHQTSANYEKDESEFDKVGLTPEFINDFPAPFVKESKFRIAMELEEELDIKSNGTKLMVGRVQNLYFERDAQNHDGVIDMKGTDTVAISGLDTYWSPQKLSQLGYARP